MLGQAATIIVSVTVVLGVLAIAAVALRLYCRYLQKFNLGGDDYCIIVSLLLSTATSVIADYVASTTGVGDRSYIPTIDTIVFSLKANLAAENLQIAAMGFAKISLLLFYRRIFITSWFQRNSALLSGIIACFSAAIILSNIFSKWPVRDQWNPTVPYNVNISAVLITYVVCNTIFDLLTLLMPLLAVRNLQMDSHRKLVLSTVFSLGSICVIASLFRLAYSIKFTKVTQTPSSLFQVPFIFNSLWSCIEPPVFIITGCCLTFRPLYRDPRPRTYLRSLYARVSKLSAASHAAPAHDDIPLRSESNCWQPIEDSNDKNATYRAHWELETAGRTENEGSATKGPSAQV